MQEAEHHRVYRQGHGNVEEKQSGNLQAGLQHGGSHFFGSEHRKDLQGVQLSRADAVLGG